jgi:hypothetical protein
MSRPQIVKFFLRMMERTPDKRQGMSFARAATEAHHYEEIVQRLMANPHYKWAAVGHPFPRSPEQIQRKIKLEKCSAEKEIAWSTIILVSYKEKLKSFVLLRSEYEKSFLHGDYDGAAAILDKIEVSHGYSNWLISSRIQLLATSDGLQAQKKYLEELLERAISPLCGWISYYFSLRSEENYSLSSIQEVTAITETNPPLFDYVTYHLNPYQILDVDDPINLISWEEMHPIIDRLHAHTVAAKLMITRGQADDQLLSSLKSLAEIGDPNIDRLIQDAKGAPDESATAIYDCFLRGEYEAVLSSETTSVELRALSFLISGTKPEESNSIIAQAVRNIVEMLLPRDGYLRAKQQLQKIALLCGHLPLTTEIASFIARTPVLSDPAELALIEKYASLSYGWGRYCLPTSIRHIDEQSVNLIENEADTSPAQKVILAAREGKDDLLCKTLPIDIRAYYSGCIALNSGDAVTAECKFREAAESPKEYVRSLAKFGLFESRRAQGDLSSAAKIAINNSLKTADRFRLYPFEALVADMRTASERIDPLLSSVLLHFASRINSSWESELSDAYENTMNAWGITRPSELDVESIDPITLYFLRSICVPRVLEDSTDFESVEEIEAERILICQKLISKDPENTTQYADEIKTITREQNVSALLQHVEANMINVDTSGVSAVVHDSLKESFERYQVLLASPDLGYQAAQINRMMKELVTKLSNKESWDVALTSSEKAGLFAEMREYFLDTFATNPAYGLDTNLSTSIRHGVIEGHIRAPFVEEDLLATKEGKEWVVPLTWADKLTNAQPTEAYELKKAFGRFSQRIEDAVKLYRDELIHIRRKDTKRQGLFFFHAQDDEIIELAQSITISTTYEEFLTRLFEHAWKLLDKSMAEIKLKIKRDLLGTLQSATEAFTKSTIHINTARQAGLIDAVVRAQTSMQAKVDEIANWFRRPTDARNTPFDIDLAARVAAKQISNCYTGDPLNCAYEIDGDLRIEGSFLNGLVEVVFLFLQNAVRHGGYHDQKLATPISIRIFQDRDQIALEFQNDLADSVDICERRHIAAEALVKHFADTAITMATSEGGSGLSKLKRILRFDIKRSYRLNLEVTDDRTFRTTLYVDSEGMKHADISN